MITTNWEKLFREMFDKMHSLYVVRRVPFSCITECLSTENNLFS